MTRDATRALLRFGVLCLLGACSFAYAQSGISRAGAAAPVAATSQPGAQRALPAPALDSMPRPTPLPGQPLPGHGGSAPAPVAAPQISITEDALIRTAPLTSAEVLELRRELLNRQQAVQQPIEPVAKPVRRAVSLDLSPTGAPEVIRLSQGQGAIIAFYDAAGRPWPITVGDGYSPRSLDVATFGANSLSVGLKARLVGRTNLAVLLEGLDTPVVLSVLPAREETDVALEVQVPRYVPSLPAPVSAAQQMASLNSSELMNFLLGTPPKEARALTADSAVVKAWQTGPNRMIVRTSALLAAPAWTRRQSSGAGVTVYELPLSPVVTVAVDGSLSLVRISGLSATAVPAPVAKVAP
ncbi:MAG: icmK [Ramlibacter sp.]|jgi:intracellular multiplication protein IcmK|nr:icmK [Ramlibacter sp.]